VAVAAVVGQWQHQRGGGGGGGHRRRNLASLGFVEAKSDTSLFVYHCGINTAYLLLYVDDIVLTTSSLELLQRTTSALQQQFTMNDIGPLHHFLGVSVEL
jgi:hypothetical protein